MILVAAPALPLHAAGKYVAGAYIVFVLVLVIYLGIMTMRTSRTNRELGELRRELAERRASQELDGNAGPGPRTGEPTASAAEPSPGTTEPEREPAL